MDSSQIQCSICGAFLNNDDVTLISTKCGHVYHQKCLNEKFAKGSRKCGSDRFKCSSLCYPHYCRRVYFNFDSYNWYYIKPDIFRRDEIEFEGFILKLGVNKNGHNIYAARTFTKNKVSKCYYNAETEKIYQNFECSLEYHNKHYELLDINKDTRHRDVWGEYEGTTKHPYRLGRSLSLPAKPNYARRS